MIDSRINNSGKAHSLAESRFDYLTDKYEDGKKSPERPF
jgi:hypothetical protein